jgi:exonuclease VII small subunit
MRGRFKQMGDTDLSRAKERVDKVVAEYAKRDLEEREKAARGRHEGV